jgi:hypothetical protein
MPPRRPWSGLGKGLDAGVDDAGADGDGQGPGVANQPGMGGAEGRIRIRRVTQMNAVNSPWATMNAPKRIRKGLLVAQGQLRGVAGRRTGARRPGHPEVRERAR